MELDFTYSALQLETFLWAIDRTLLEPQQIVVVGAAAACLQHECDEIAAAIDTATDNPALIPAFKIAKQLTGLQIPVRTSPSLIRLRDIESRLVRFQAERTRMLKIMIPDPADLVITMLDRLGPHRLATLRKIIVGSRLTADGIINRFENSLIVAPTSRLEIEHNLYRTLEYTFANSLPSEQNN